MIEYNNLSDISLAEHEQCVVAIGFFDGLHLAHQAIVQECLHRAQQRNVKAAVFTFQNHPSSIISPGNSVPLLSPYPLKAMRLNKLGIDIVVGVPFDQSLSEIPANDFVEDILIHKLHAIEIVVGFNFHFGHKRGGSPELLQSYAPAHFDDVNVIESQTINDKLISSTAVRQAITGGRLGDAQEMLGQRYQLFGEVVHGDGRGATIGFPTANIDTQNQLLPPNGIYGVRVWRNSFDSDPIWGAMNVGVIPTFKEDQKRLAEVYLLDHKEDLYGQNLIVELCHYVREERRFDGVDALVEAINRDISEIREWINNNSG